MNTCIETGGNIAPDQANPQPPIQRQQFQPQYDDDEHYEDYQPYQQENYVPLGHQARGFMNEERMVFGFDADEPVNRQPAQNLEFTPEETKYYNYKLDKGSF